MLGLTTEYLDFLPGKMVKGAAQTNMIYIFSHMNNKRKYKNKSWVVGAIGWQDKIKEWVYVPNPNGVVSSMRANTMYLISRFIQALNTNRVKFNEEEGELNY